MKARKVIKKLTKIQSWMSSLSEQYAEASSAIRDSLTAAEVSVNRAKALIAAAGNPASAQKGAERVEKGRASSKQRTRGALTDQGRKKLSLAAKRRWAAAKRQGMKTLAAQR